MANTRDKARALGLDKLTDEHLAQFERAATNIKRLTDRLPKDLPVAQESAHVYQAAGAKR
ncbi:MAG: hypothetical protein WDO24_24645 [Pseudomonadota bacterium]